MSTTNYTAVKAMFLILPRHGHVSDAPCCVKEARLKRVSGYKAIYGTIWKGQNDSNRRHKRWPGFGSRRPAPKGTARGQNCFVTGATVTRLVHLSTSRRWHQKE